MSAFSLRIDVLINGADRCKGALRAQLQYQPKYQSYYVSDINSVSESVKGLITNQYRFYRGELSLFVV